MRFEVPGGGLTADYIVGKHDAIIRRYIAKGWKRRFGPHDPRCAGTTKDGRPCPNYPTLTSPYCLKHREQE